MTQSSPPEPLAEAARDLHDICDALNVLTPVAQVLETDDQTKATHIGWAYSAVAEAIELAAGVQRDPNRYGLDAVVGALVVLMLRRVARDLEAETDLWNQARPPPGATACPTLNSKPAPPNKGPARCRGSEYITAGKPMNSPRTFRSGSSGSRKSQGYPGRRSPATLRPVPTPYGIGLNAE